MKNGLISILIIALLIGVVLLINQSSDIARDERPEVGFMAPDFTLKDVNGEAVTLSQFRGEKPVFINFWASWCPPCKEEMPFIQKAYQKYHDDVQFIGVNLTAKDVKQDAIDFMQQNGYDMPVLYDEKGKTENLYRIYSVPTTFFVNKDGMIVSKHSIGMSYQVIESSIKDILGD